uniref:Golgi associated, gamma adaptin ear containing, ARF binding protein 3b n=1 Tax=Cyprinus carpio TaxID=7962 RepID=A0A8C1ZXG0_CYPCA
MRIMAFPEGESLESWLNKATHPTNRQEDWEYIIGFCDQINKELEGPQIAVRLLVHKIHSQEWEALQALTVLEACMKNCGRRFHNEIARYRFLNELIKVVSPKYMGDSVSEKVKNKIIEMLYSWTVAFPNEAKIADAYQTLKRQGLVMSDPELTVDKTLIPSPPTRPKNPVFDNEDMGKLLAELLRSKNPEDLQEANRLIKNMVKEDEARVQKMTKRSNTLEEVNNNVKLLSEIVTQRGLAALTCDLTSCVQELYERCDKLRRTAFKLATEAEDNDSSLGKWHDGPLYSQGKMEDCLFEMFLIYLIPVGDILKANDDLSRVIGSYKRIVEGQADDGDGEDLRPSSPARSSDPSLSNLNVPLESIRPSKVLPVTLYDKDGVRVLMHFAMDCPPGRPDVLVMVVSLLNTAPLPVRSIVLQAAVPKSMRVKLQPPSGAEIAPFNPILPPASITQVMLLANPLKERVRLRYKLTYLLGEHQYSEVGELDQFPPADRWGSL